MALEIRNNGKMWEDVGESWRETRVNEPFGQPTKDSRNRELVLVCDGDRVQSGVNKDETVEPKFTDQRRLESRYQGCDYWSQMRGHSGTRGALPEREYTNSMEIG
jgi:hypothetical protein